MQKQKQRNDRALFSLSQFFLYMFRAFVCLMVVVVGMHAEQDFFPLLIVGNFEGISFLS
jgi:hypothetical protein